MTHAVTTGRLTVDRDRGLHDVRSSAVRRSSRSLPSLRRRRSAILIASAGSRHGAPAEDHVRARAGGVERVHGLLRGGHRQRSGTSGRARRSDDLLAASAAEVGALFTGLTLVLGHDLGSGRPGVSGGHGIARLTSTAVLFLIFVGYLALRVVRRRSRIGARSGARRWASSGALNVPIVYMSVKWWRTLHQMQSSPSTLDPAVRDRAADSTRIALLLVLDLLHHEAGIEAARIERAAEHLAERAALGGAWTCPDRTGRSSSPRMS